MDISGVEKILFSMHMMLAGAVKSPELAISEQEAKMLASSIGEVSKHYDMGMDAKTQAWINLTMVAGSIYVPRIIMMVKPKKKVEQKQDGSVDWSLINGLGQQG